MLRELSTTATPGAVAVHAAALGQHNVYVIQGGLSVVQEHTDNRYGSPELRALARLTTPCQLRGVDHLAPPARRADCQGASPCRARRHRTVRCRGEDTMLNSSSFEIDYATRVTHLRVYKDREWWLDAADERGRFTETCFSFDKFAEVIAAIPGFVAETSRDGVRYVWRTGAPTPTNECGLCGGEVAGDDRLVTPNLDGDKILIHADESKCL